MATVSTSALTFFPNQKWFSADINIYSYQLIILLKWFEYENAKDSASSEDTSVCFDLFCDPISVRCLC